MIFNTIVGIFIFGIPATLLFSLGVLYGLSKYRKLNKENQMETENHNLSQNIENCENQECKGLTLTAEDVDRYKVFLNSDYYRCQNMLVRHTDILDEEDMIRLRDEMRKDSETLNRIYKWQGRI